MDYVLRCNNLSCRSELQHQAIATSCSHIFCEKCADANGFVRANLASRSCPACRAPLHDKDDVVLTGLNPSEEYKTTILCGLSPAIISECANRALVFWSYQATQEIVYQESLAKSLTEKYNTLEQQLEQILADANSQIDFLQEKMRGMQEERADLEKKNNELGDAFREKSHSQQKIQKMYQQLKAQVMAGHVADAAGDEADMAIHTARGDRFVNRIPGARSGGANLSYLGSQNIGGERHRNRGSNSSGSNEQQRGAIGIGPHFGSHLQVRGLGSRVNSGHSAFAGTPGQSQGHRSRIPAAGGQRQNYLTAERGSEYRASPMMRQSMGTTLGSRNVSNNLGFGSRLKRPLDHNNTGPLQL